MGVSRREEKKMKIEGDSILYTWFEIYMDSLFHKAYGSTSGLPHEQSYWPQIMELKRLAREEE